MPNEVFLFNEIVGDSNDPNLRWEISNVFEINSLIKGMVMAIKNSCYSKEERHI